ncbi:MAG: nucleotide sugar dehydrogenase [Pseudomonadota bacterium]
MNIAVFGLGYVGAVSSACLADAGHDVVGVDIATSKVDMINAGEAPIVEELIAELMATAVQSGRLRATLDANEAVQGADLSLVSVGTPTGIDGAPNFDFVETVIRQIGAACREREASHTVVIRSTVVPGATMQRFAPILEEASGKKLGQGIDIAVNPEFLREGKSVFDFRNPPFTVIGATTRTAIDAVAGLYAGIGSEVIEASPEAAEAIKILCNAWHGLKVAFANEAGRILSARDIDAREVMSVFVKDTVLNISPAYLRPGYAFGGSCLPKDLRALVDFAERAGAAAPVMRASLISNQDHINLAVDKVMRFGRKPAALFGLSFKPGTDDLRESPYVALAERLIGKGFDLRIVDPHVDASRLMGKNKAFIEREIPHFVELLQNDADRAVAESEIIIFGHGGERERVAIEAGARGKAILDLAGVDTFQSIAGAYQGICW